MTPPQPSTEKPPFWRYQYIFPAIAAFAGLTVAIVAVFSLVSDSEKKDRVVDPTLGVEPEPPQMTAPTSFATGASGASTSVTAAPPSELLGRDRPSTFTESCRAPGIATGAAWQLGPVQMAGRRFDVAYYCNLVSGGSGSMTFTLSKEFRQLRVSVGFADAAGSSSHTVRFELIGDDKDHLTEPKTLRFGESEDLEVNVEGVTRLKMQVTELGRPGGSGQPSEPVFAGLSLIRVQ